MCTQNFLMGVDAAVPLNITVLESKKWIITFTEPFLQGQEPKNRDSCCLAFLAMTSS